jgi:hypothetical protein
LNFNSEGGIAKGLKFWPQNRKGNETILCGRKIKFPPDLLKMAEEGPSFVVMLFT